MICKYGKAGPAPDSGFLPKTRTMQERTDCFPFQRYHCDWGEMATFTSIIVAPVDTTHIERLSWWETINTRAWSKTRLHEDRLRMAEEMQESFERAIRDDPKRRFRIADRPGPHTALLELALTELVPSKVFFNIITTAAGFFVPGAGAIDILGQSTVAMEGRVRDSESGQIVCMFADREKPKFAPIYLGSYTWYVPAREIINEWAKQFLAINNVQDPLKVKDSRVWRLRPW
jgi:hypothetical protein